MNPEFQPLLIDVPMSSEALNQFAVRIHGTGWNRTRFLRFRRALGILAKEIYPPDEATNLVNLMIWRSQRRTTKSFLEYLKHVHAQN